MSLLLGREVERRSSIRVKVEEGRSISLKGTKLIVGREVYSGARWQSCDAWVTW